MRWLALVLVVAECSASPGTIPAIELSAMDPGYGWCPEIVSWPLGDGAIPEACSPVGETAFRCFGLDATRQHFRTALVTLGGDTATLELEGGPAAEDCGEYAVATIQVPSFRSAWAWPNEGQ